MTLTARILALLLAALTPHHHHLRPVCGHDGRCRMFGKTGRSHAPPMHTALASWYDDAGMTASGRHYTYGFAALIFGSEWGRTVRFCYRGRCVVGRLDDHGPYVSGRTFDLEPGAQGCARMP